MHPVTRSTAFVIVALGIVACDDQNGGEQSAPDMPRFGEAELATGRSAWMGTCRNCHLLGVAGAPAVTNYSAWEPRITKGKERLYESALNGIRDDVGEIRMPPRGGNARMSEDQVRRAVDYMVASVEHFHRQP